MSYRTALVVLGLMSVLTVATVCYLIGYAIGTATWPPFIAAMIITASAATIAFLIVSDRKDY